MHLAELHERQLRLRSLMVPAGSNSQPLDELLASQESLKAEIESSTAELLALTLQLIEYECKAELLSEFEAERALWLEKLPGVPSGAALRPSAKSAPRPPSEQAGTGRPVKRSQRPPESPEQVQVTPSPD